jgi:DNA-damage-inducible protein J
MNETVKNDTLSSCMNDEKVSQVTVTEEEYDSDLFFSERNMAHLRRGISALNEGRGVVHEIVDVD